MASGKTLELKEIQKQAGDPMCIKPDCGLPWSAHTKKKPNKWGYHERLARYKSLEHRVMGTLVLPPSPKLTKAEHKREKKRRLSRG